MNSRLFAGLVSETADVTPDTFGLTTSKSLFLALYVATKLLVWPRSTTWYDNECLYTMGWLMAERKSEAPSNSRWVYEQSLVQQHSYFTDTFAAREHLSL